MGNRDKSWYIQFQQFGVLLLITKCQLWVSHLSRSAMDQPINRTQKPSHLCPKVLRRWQGRPATWVIQHLRGRLLAHGFSLMQGPLKTNKGVGFVGKMADIYRQKTFQMGLCFKDWWNSLRWLVSGWVSVETFTEKKQVNTLYPFADLRCVNDLRSFGISGWPVST